MKRGGRLAARASTPSAKSRVAKQAVCCSSVASSSARNVESSPRLSAVLAAASARAGPRQPLRELEGRAWQVGRHDDLVHEADAQGLRGVDDLAGHHELRRLCQAHDPRQEKHPAERRHAAEVDPDLAEARALRGDPDVAGERDLAPGAHGRAVDGGDHGLVHRANVPGHALKGAVDHLADEGRRHGRQLLEERQVPARREGAVRARDHHGALTGVGGAWGVRRGLLEAVGQRRHGWDGQGIEGIGPVERERPDPSRLLDPHKVCHGVLLERGRGAENLRQPGYRGNARIAILSPPLSSGLG